MSNKYEYIKKVSEYVSELRQSVRLWYTNNTIGLPAVMSNDYRGVVNSTRRTLKSESRLQFLGELNQRKLNSHTEVISTTRVCKVPERLTMSHREFARLIDGKLCGDNMTHKEKMLAKKSGLYVIYGAKDNLVYIKGLTNDFIDYYDKKDKIYIYNRSVIQPNRDIFKSWQDQFDYLAQFGIQKTDFKAIYPIQEKTNKVLSFTTGLPYSTFNVYDNDKLFCVGIVVSV